MVFGLGFGFEYDVFGCLVISFNYYVIQVFKFSVAVFFSATFLLRFFFQTRQPTHVPSVSFARAKRVSEIQYCTYCTLRSKTMKPPEDSAIFYRSVQYCILYFFYKYHVPVTRSFCGASQ